MPASPFAVAVELDAAASDALDIRALARLAQFAEHAGVTALTFDDAPGSPGRRLDAVQRAAYLAPLTSAIGLVAATRPAYVEPFHVATQLASLDWASQGRAGWLPVADSGAVEAAAFGRDLLDEAAVRRERDDAIEVSRRLWDSWQDDAVIADVTTGRYLDADRLHYVDFVGATYRITGPLITPRPPQGQLVVLGPAGTAGVDVALVPATGDLPAAASAARSAGAARVWADVVVDAVEDRATGLSEGRAAALAAQWAELAGVVDGVHVRLASAAGGASDSAALLDAIGSRVLPTLRGTIGFRSPLAGDTLRTTLGLERPVNRYTREAAA